MIGQRRRAQSRSAIELLLKRLVLEFGLPLRWRRKDAAATYPRHHGGENEPEHHIDSHAVLHGRPRLIDSIMRRSEQFMAKCRRTLTLLSQDKWRRHFHSAIARLQRPQPKTKAAGLTGGFVDQNPGIPTRCALAEPARNPMGTVNTIVVAMKRRRASDHFGIGRTSA
jgi:hypothetical protein